MKNDTILQTLYDHAVNYRLTSFYDLFDSYTREAAEIDPEIYLLRGQLKLMCADPTAIDDLKRAAEIQTPSVPCLSQRWQPQAPNAFIVFGAKAAHLTRFLSMLPDAATHMNRHYGNLGLAMIQQIECEILYYTGHSDHAIPLAQAQYQAVKADAPVAQITAGYVLLRIYMAQGLAQQAQEILLDIIAAVRKNPDSAICAKVYQTVRDWVNLTTGWSGDMPRYHCTPDNIVLPVLEDRSAAIRNGIDALVPTETAFVDYAARLYPDTYTVRTLFMDVFHTIDAFRSGRFEDFNVQFQQAYRVSYANNLVMPFAEYGLQVVPMLQYVTANHQQYDSNWLSQIIKRAESYEKGLVAFRGCQ